MDSSGNDDRHRRSKVVRLSMITLLAGVITPASWRIAGKAGYPPALGLLMIVSPLNLLLLWRFATREWPIERELRRAREQANRVDDTTS